MFAKFQGDMELDQFLSEDHEGGNFQSFRKEVREFSLDNLQVGFDEKINNNQEIGGEKEEEPPKIQGKQTNGDLKSWL